MIKTVHHVDQYDVRCKIYKTKSYNQLKEIKAYIHNFCIYIYTNMHVDIRISQNKMNLHNE